ncbi:uncharacterized protein LOC130962292 [Arachis stenosperma]|uniref:uncharacterized protein LOC130962292 n=1 Tax=Arachis stenosperma TaxID=217475 RepID=UPI0025AC09EE|nr:uncharacterized protein LOC130962292 [Arachis stenosperma]XP_057744477.1 uncharacterized protein LOC130962292 [Arachis stenosperma]XP_057744478.1 uncharacterized protein LOC130962292 [Arachis stenosperma]
MEAIEELSKYEETIKHLFKLLNKVCQERDEARYQLQSILKSSQPSNTSYTSHHFSQSSMEITKKPYLSNKALFAYCSNEKLPSTCDSSHHARTKKEPSKLALFPNHENRTTTIEKGVSKCDFDHSASLVIDELVLGKPLPQKGRLLRSVAEAGPLLQTLLIAPLPKWQNPPPSPPSSSSYPPSCIVNDDKDNNSVGDQSVSVIPTSLSLAFPGNYSGASLHNNASSEFELLVKNEPISWVDHKDSSIFHNNHMLIGKKRKLI